MPRKERVLIPEGRACIASLTRGVSLPSRIVAALWMTVFRTFPTVVGGCRPLRPGSFVDAHKWRVVHQRVVVAFGVPSEVLVVEKKGNGPRAPSVPAAARRV